MVAEARLRLSPSERIQVPGSWLLDRWMCAASVLTIRCSPLAVHSLRSLPHFASPSDFSAWPLSASSVFMNSPKPAESQ